MRSIAFADFLIGLGILFAPKWGLAGVAAGMALAKLVTYLPLQGYQVHRILRMPDVPVESGTTPEPVVA